MSLTSIWTNTRYNSTLKPVPLWSFEVDFRSMILNEKNKDSYSKILNQSVVSCSWPERSINMVEVFYAGVNAKLPGRVQNSGELQIKFNEMNDLGVTKVLEELFHAEASCDAYFRGNGPYAFNKNFNKVNRSIRMLIHKTKSLMEQDIDTDSDAKDNIIGVIVFHNCVLSKIDATEFSYENEDDILTKTGTFTYDYFTVHRGETDKLNDDCLGDEYQIQ